MELKLIHNHVTEFLGCNQIEPKSNWVTKNKAKKKLRGLSPRADYTDRAAAAGRRS